MNKELKNKEESLPLATKQSLSATPSSRDTPQRPVKTDCHFELQNCHFELQNCHSELVSESHSELQNCHSELVSESHFPNIRFAEFSDSWQEKKLGEVAERVTRKNLKLESTLPLTISAQYGLIDQNEFFDKRIASKDVSGYYLIKNGEFAYNKSTSTEAPWGAIKRLDRYENGVLSTLYIVFKIKDDKKTDSQFLASFYDGDKWHFEIQAIAAEGARNHGLLNIAVSDFFDTKFNIPNSLTEQQKIGSYFATLDKKITAQKAKVEQLKTLKKYMLQNMFPQTIKNAEQQNCHSALENCDSEQQNCHSELVSESHFKLQNCHSELVSESHFPKIRFAGFSDPWEEKLIKDVCLIATGKSNTQDQVENGEYPFFIRSDIPVRSNKFLYDCEAVITIGDGNIGRVFHYINGKFDLHQRCYKMTDFKNVTGIYFYYFFSTFFYNRAMRMSAKGTVDSVRMEMISEMPIFLPSLPEQQKIGSYFATLDKNIANQNAKLGQLQTLKKYMLQNMFC